MTEPSAKPRWRRFGKYLLLATAAGWVLLGFALWYTTTDSFQYMVRRRLVAELERITGGRVELGGFHTIPFRFQVDVRGLTVHGREAPGEIPYAHVDRLVAEVKLISVLGAEFGFRSVVLDRPVVHIIVYPDGTTNQPEPEVKQTSGKTSIEKLFSLSINRLEMRKGEFLWNDRTIPLDCIVNDVSADMSYSILHRRYDSSLLLGKVDTKFKDYRPLAWMVEAHFSLGQDYVVVRSLKATSGRSRLEASGRLENFSQPKIAGTYSVALDLGEASAIARQPELRRGVVQADGQGTWSMREFSATGKLSVKDFEWRDQSIALRNASWSSDFTVTSQRLTLSQIQAKLLAGDVKGDAEIVNWLSSSSKNQVATGKGLEEQKGSVRLRMKDLSAYEIAAALSSSARPLGRMNLAGLASGSIETRWRGAPRNAEAEIALEVTAPARLKPGQLPLNVHAHAIYRNAPAELEVSEFQIATRATQVRGAWHAFFDRGSEVIRQHKRSGRVATYS